MIIIAAVTPTPNVTSNGISASTATLISAVIALVVTLIANIVAGRRQDMTYRRELNLRRLNELYAPLALLLAQDLVLIRQIRLGKEDPDNWHLLKNISTVLGDEQDGAIARQILEINRKIAKILEEKSGLCLVSMTSSSSLFLGHYAMMERALAGKVFVRGPQFELFPKCFEEDVQGGYSKLSSLLKIESG